MADDKTPDKTGTENKTDAQKWQELGFASEAELIAAAQEAKDLRGKVAEKEAELEKEKSAKQKQSSDFMRQSNEIGELRKKLTEAEQRLQTQKPPEADKSDDEILDSLSEDETKKYDEELKKPENSELKKAVLAGGKKAMAEFVRSYRQNAPVNAAADSVFSSFRKKKQDFVSKASVASMVKSLFEKNENENRNKLPATPPAGSPTEKETATKKVSQIGTVTTDFFRKDKTTA